MVAPSSTTANADMMSLGKNKDSSGVYFDKDGKPIVEGDVKYQHPTVDTVGAVKITFDKLKKYPSYRVLDGSVCILKTEFGGSLLTEMNGVMHDGNETKEHWNIQFEDNSTGLGFYRVWSKSGFQDVSLAEWRLPIKVITDSILEQGNSFMSQLMQYKFDAETELLWQKQLIQENRSDEVAKVCELLGITPEQAEAYLAAGHTVEEAAKKVSDWNLASPSSRKAMIAQDALNIENAFAASEFVAGKAGDTIKYEAVPTDDMFKYVRNKYKERIATKAYISLVKESSDNLAIDSRRKSNPSLLLKFEKFYMQSVSEVDSEKYQIVETFNKPKIYFFDRRARIYNYSFVVENTGNLHTSQINRRIIQETGGNLWRDEFKNVYERYLRGTKSVEERVKAVIHYDGVTRIGYVLSCAMSMDSNNDNLAQMQITMFVESEQQRDIPIEINTNFDNSEPIKKLNAQEMYKKQTETYIVGRFNSQKLSYTDIKVPVNIFNINSPGRQTFPKNNYVELFLKEFPQNQEGNPDTAEKSAGGAKVVGMTWIATLASTRMESVDYPIDGLFLSDTPEANAVQSFSEGSNIPIELSGTKLYVVIDTKSKMVQEIAAKQGNKDAKVDYTFLLESENKKEFRIRGSAILHPQVLEPSISEPGNLQAKTLKDRQETFIEASSQNMTSVFNNGTTIQKLFTGSFELQLTDKVSGTVVALPKSIKVSPPVFKDFIASINESDKSLISGSLVATPKDVNTLRCEVNLNLDVTGQDITMTAESCIAEFKLDIGGTPVRVVVKFIRGADKKDYRVVHAISTYSATKNKLEQVPMAKESNIFLQQRVSILFSSDPGPSISREILFKIGSNISSVIKPEAKGVIESNLKLYSADIVNFIYSFQTDAVVNYEITARIGVISGPRKISKAEAAKLLYITEEEVYLVEIVVTCSSPNTYINLAVSTRARGESYKLNSDKVQTTNNFSEIQNVFLKGSIKIAKTSMESAVVLGWGNTSKEYIRI